MTPTRCPRCGSPLVRDVRPDRIRYKGASVRVQQPGWYCTGRMPSGRKCPEVLLDPADVEATEPAFVALQARVDALALPPQEIRRIRQRLRLSQVRAGELLGGGPRAFQKYEAGTEAPAAAATNLLWLLDRHPELVAELEARKAG